MVSEDELELLLYFAVQVQSAFNKIMQKKKTRFIFVSATEPDTLHIL